MVEASEESAGDGSAIAIIDGEEFEFDLTTCNFGDEELLMSGPGKGGSEDEAAWFDVELVQVGDEWGGGMQIMLGTAEGTEDTGRGYHIFMAAQGDHSLSTASSDGEGQMTFTGTATLEDGNSKGSAQIAVACGGFVLDDSFDDGFVEIEEFDEADNSSADGVAACLEGTWIADNDYFLDRLQELGDEAQSVTGEVTVIFQDDGVMLTRYDEWVIESSIEDMDVEIHRDGMDQAEYSVSGDTIDIRDVHLDSRMKIVTPVYTSPAVPTELEYAGASVTCDANSASITLDEGVMQLIR